MDFASMDLYLLNLTHSPMKSDVSQRSSLSTKKSFKQIYDENRLLYAKKTVLEFENSDPDKASEFLRRFYAKRKRQQKLQIYLFALSCVITWILVLGVMKTFNLY